MEPKRMIELTVGIVVGLVVFSAILMPVVNNTTATEKTFTNDGYYRMAEIGDDAVTIVWDHTEPKQITVNDEVVDLTKVPTNKLVTITVTDETIIRYAPITSDTLIQVYSSAGYYGAGVTAGTDMTITIEEGTLTADNGSGTTVSKTITNGYYVSNNGKWIMKTDGESAFIHKDDSVIVLAGNTTVGGATIGVYGNGTINDGLNIETVPTDSVARVVTYGDVTFDYTDVTGYIDLVKLSKCQFDITYDDTTATATYSYFLIPYEVTAELSSHLDANEIQMIKVIPILIIAGLILGIVTVVVSRRE